MSRTGAAVLVLCACSHATPGARRPAPAPAAEDRAVVAATALLDAARGDELLTLASAVPAELRRPVAFRLLLTRSGQCVQCFGKPPSEPASLASPCTRDHVIETLVAGSAEASVPHDVLRTAAKASDEVVVAIGGSVPSEQLVELWGALDPPSENRGWQVQALAARLSADHVTAMFRSRPSTALLPVLDPDRDSELLIATATDRASRPGLRAAAARRLTDATSVDRAHADRLLATFTALRADPDCDVAAAAIEGLRWLGVPSVLPVAPQTTNAATLLHMVCVLAKTHVGDSGYEADLYRSYVGPAGVTVVDTSIEQQPVVDHVDPRSGPIYRVTYALAGSTCTGATCTDVGSRVDIEVQPDASGRQWITKLVRIRQPVDCVK